MHTRLVTYLSRLILACGILLALPGQAMGDITLTGPSSVSESAGVATYTVTCGGELLDVGPAVVSAAPATGATEGDDYQEPSVVPILCVALTESTHTVDVPIVNDTEDETAESFTVSTLVPAQSVETTIVDDDPVAGITPVAFIVEGDSGTQMANLTVTLASAAAEVTTIGFETEDLSATTGSDYTATSGDLVFQLGQTTKTISVPVVGDAVPEGPEGFFVNLLSTDNGSLSSTAKQGAVGIFDNDEGSLPTVSLTKPSVSIQEGNGGTGNILFNVTLSSNATQRTEVNWKTGDWTADKSDYASDSGKLVFQTGQKSKTISVDVKGDRQDEPDEAFTVALESPVGAALGARKAAFGVIEDDDGPKMRIRKSKVRGKKLVTKIECPESATGCKGSLATKVGKRKLKTKRFDLDGGAGKKIKQKLPASLREAMEDARKRAKLKATATDDSGDTRVTKRKTRLKRIG